MQAQLTTLNLENIYPDDHQPRKFFDESAMAELTESVKSNGILQPIMVRPNGTILAPKSKSGETLYRIVCGERRYRAAEAAGLTEIPAVIRELTDEEALEIQIVENLQRKDVNPMEEAVAFKSLRAHYDLKEIAYKVGKSETYVARRISLNGLTEAFQELVYAGKVTLTDAYKLARISENDQAEVYKDCRIPKDWQKKKDYEVEYIDSYISNVEHDLDKAKFKTEDAELYPEAGACNGCRYNSKSNQLLFPDLNKKRICHNGACFQIKSSRAYQATLEKVMADPDMLFISFCSYPQTEDKQKLKAAKDMGITVLEDGYEVVSKPDPYGTTLEEYLAEMKEDMDYEEMSAKEQKEAIKEWTNDYNDNVQEYRDELATYEKGIKNASKAFAITGNYQAKEGEVISVVLKGAAKGKKIEVTKDTPEDLQLLAVEQEIAGIEERRKRNQELDREKVQAEMYKLFEPDEKNHFLHDMQLLTEEESALIYALTQSSYTVRNEVQSLLNIGYDSQGAKFYEKIKNSRGVLGLPWVVRLFLRDKLIIKNKMDPGKYGNAAAMLDMAKIYFPAELASLQADQQVRTDKREGNVVKRLAALNTKAGELKVAQNANKVAPKAIPKKKNK